MNVHLVDDSCGASTLRKAALQGCNKLHDLSLEVGALAGLLELIAGNKNGLDEYQAMAIGALADMALGIESKITGISDELGESIDGAAAPAMVGGG